MKPGWTFTLCALKHSRYMSPTQLPVTDLTKAFFILLNIKCSSILTFQKRVYWTEKINGKLNLVGSKNSCAAQVVLKTLNKYSSNKVAVIQKEALTQCRSAVKFSEIHSTELLPSCFFLLLLGLLIVSWTHHSQTWTGPCSAIFWHYFETTVWWSFHFQHTHRSWQL